MVDFTAKRDPALLQALIQAKSRSKTAIAMGGIGSGVEKGLALTEQVKGIMDRKKRAKEISAIMQKPEYKAIDEETGGMLSMAPPEERAGLFIKLQMEKNKTAAQDKRYKEFAKTQGRLKYETVSEFRELANKYGAKKANQMMVDKYSQPWLDKMTSEDPSDFETLMNMSKGEDNSNPMGAAD